MTLWSAPPEPVGPARFVFPPPSEWPAEDLIALGGDLSPPTLVGAYRRGIFPMVLDARDPDPVLGWWSPDPRGILPLDRPHQGKIFGSYLTPFGLTVGVGATVGSGAPLTPLASNPAYRSAGEIPEAPRGSGIQTQDGFRERTPAEVQFDLHLDYGVPIAGKRLTLVADVFNLFDQQRAIDYDNFTEITFGDLKPDFGTPKAGGGFITQYHAPLQVRLGARFEW